MFKCERQFSILLNSYNFIYVVKLKWRRTLLRYLEIIIILKNINSKMHSKFLPLFLIKILINLLTYLGLFDRLLKLLMIFLQVWFVLIRRFLCETLFLYKGHSRKNQQVRKKRPWLHRSRFNKNWYACSFHNKMYLCNISRGKSKLF